jgi:hypothetical protein
MDLYSIDVSPLGDTIWVTGDDGSCVGRFSKRFGIDVRKLTGINRLTGENAPLGRAGRRWPPRLMSLLADERALAL